MNQIAHNRPAGGPANALARQAAAALEARQAAADGPQQYRTFLLGGEMFAVAILNVKVNIVKVLSVDEIASLASVTDNGSRLSEAAGVAA